MKDPSDNIRTWLYGVLNTTVSYGGSVVPVYSFAPKDAAMPYILLAGQSSSSELDESTKDCYINKHSFTIEIYSSHTGNDATYKAVNTISNSVLVLVRTRTAPTISGFTVISVVLDSMLTDMMDFDTKIVAIKILNLTMIIEEV
jgi:hypothetical protein